MKTNELKARIVHKHDSEANWNLANNFIPLDGELIVYSPDETSSCARLKMGDGKTLVKDLGILNPISSGSGENSIKSGINTDGIAAGTGAIGNNSFSGRKAFYIKSVDFTNKKIYLTNE